MNQITGTIQNIFSDRPLQEDEYRNESDNLIHCAKCKTPRQHHVVVLGKEMVVPIRFAEHRILLIYLGVINLVTFIVFAIDKANARANRSRIRIVTLLGLSFAGGSVGGLISMYLFRHKTQKDYFTVGMPLI